MTSFLGFLYYLLALAQYGFIAYLLLKFQKAKTAFPRDLVSGSDLPGVSVLIPVKGLIGTFEENLRSLLNQDYGGPVEVVLGAQDENDPAVAFARRIADSQPSRISLKLATGGPDAGLNPKISNLARAYGKATHSWLYCGDAGVRLDPDHLRRCMTTVKADPTRFATTMSVSEQPSSLGARLECIGVNLEASSYFLARWSKSARDSMNGSSMFFHQQLLDRAGGFSVCLDRLTDDVVFGREFARAGGTGSLVPGVVREKAVSQSLETFYARLSRRSLIRAAFQPEVFKSAPAFWVWQWLVIVGFGTMHPALVGLGAAAFALRLAAAVLAQIVLEAPFMDIKNVWLLPIYDILAPVAWVQSLFRREVIWAGSSLAVEKNGTLLKK